MEKTVLEVELRGICESYDVAIDPCVILIPGKILQNTVTRRKFKVICSYASAVTVNLVSFVVASTKGAITSKIKHAIKHKTIPARLAQLLQPSLAFCFSLQPVTAYGTAYGKLRYKLIELKLVEFRGTDLQQESVADPVPLGPTDDHGVHSVY